ncbi:MAG TPA: amidohydrolase family protein [Gemmatimonadales bacterium]|nr:amidohydrolase family protein [Gemmatimonadales bacterium]
MIERNLLLGSALFLLAAPLEGQMVTHPQEEVLVLNHITVVDVTGGPSRPDMAVAITGGRIAFIVPSAGAGIPRGAKVVNAAGKYLIPGLWDMHVHLTEAPAEGDEIARPINVDARAYYVPLLVANGVLSARDMGGILDTLTSWRREIAAGKTLGPRLMVTGFKLGSANPVVPGAPAPVQTPEQVRTAVEMLRQHGADFVKLDLPLEYANLYSVVAEASKRESLMFVGHVPLTLNPGDAAALGQRSIEHLMQVPLACSSEEERLRRRLRGLRAKATFMEKVAGWSLWYRGLPHEYAVSERIAATYDSAKAAALFKRFVDNGTWQTPTLFLERDRALHIPGNGLELESRYGLASKMRRPSRPFTPENSARSKAYFRRELQIVGAMYRAGVGILAGTDLPVGHAIPGYGLHEELSLMVESGLPPLAALQTATLNPARFFGLTDSLGTVEQGKVADLIVLGADPLADIKNTNRIDAVIMRGSFIDRQELDRILDKVALRVREENKKKGVTQP